jgi:transposase-like protein
MKKSNVVSLPTASSFDPLSEALRSGARRMLAAALLTEADDYCRFYEDRRDDEGRRLVTRNGFSPSRVLQTGLGPIEVAKPKIRFRGDAEASNRPEVPFSSQLLPPYLKRTKSIEELIPWLYLRGISTGDFPQALQTLLGEDAAGLSATNIVRLKQAWSDEYAGWDKRSLADNEYVYIWVDGIYFSIRLEGERQCILVIMGVNADGVKELIAVRDGVRESELSWKELLLSLRDRGMQAPKLAVGDGALGFWKALDEIYPMTKRQRCWVHKTKNILNKLPKSLHKQAKAALAEIYTAATEEQAKKAVQRFYQTYGAKYHRAVDCLKGSIEELLAFYAFPAEHWSSLRTTNPIESSFATVRLRTKRTKGSGSACLSMVFRLLQCAQKRWHRLRGFQLLLDVKEGEEFKDGLRKVA